MRTIAWGLWAAACTPAGDGTPGGTEEPSVDPESLAALDLLTWDGTAFVYADGVVPYTLATPLFSDFALKDRAVRLPEGEQATIGDDGRLSFPRGTVLVKSFLYPADRRDPGSDRHVVETRVLTLEDDGWDAWPYLWDDDQTGATRAPSGKVLEQTFIDTDGTEVTFPYLVPQRNQCVDCHELGVGDLRENVPIGPTVRNLDHGDQLQQLVDAGVLDEIPADRPAAATLAGSLDGVDPTGLPDEVLFPAARDYLDVNCAHCHNPGGTEGRSSQLFLDWQATDPFHLGVCKKPGSAGRGTGGLTYDIVPGDPEASILWYRIQTAEIGEMMPDIGRSLIHEEGVALVAEWIRRLEGTCSEP